MRTAILMCTVLLSPPPLSAPAGLCQHDCGAAHLHQQPELRHRGGLAHDHAGLAEPRCGLRMAEDGVPEGSERPRGGGAHSALIMLVFHDYDTTL